MVAGIDGTRPTSKEEEEEEEEDEGVRSTPLSEEEFSSRSGSSAAGNPHEGPGSRGGEAGLEADAWRVWRGDDRGRTLRETPGRDIPLHHVFQLILPTKIKM